MKVSPLKARFNYDSTRTGLTQNVNKSWRSSGVYKEVDEQRDKHATKPDLERQWV